MIKLNGPLNLNEKTLKPKILGAKSIRYKNKDGTQIQRRLDEDNDLNLGKELMKLSKERNNLSLGQGGNMMTRTYTLKRFSSTTKTYRIKRKTFGVVGDVMNPVADVANNTINTGVDLAKKGVGTAMDVGGKTASLVGRTVKKASTPAAAAAFLLTPGGLVAKTLAAGAVKAATNLGGKVVDKVGESVGDAGENLTMS